MCLEEHNSWVNIWTQTVWFHLAPGLGQQLWCLKADRAKLESPPQTRRGGSLEGGEP